MTHIEATKCDNCNKTDAHQRYDYPHGWYKLTVNYHSQDTKCDFCSKKCMVEFVEKFGE